MRFGEMLDADLAAAGVDGDRLESGELQRLTIVFRVHATFS